MKNNATLAYSVVLIIGDFLALLAAFTVAYILRVKVDPRPLIAQIPALTFFYATLAILPMWILVHAFIGLYSQGIYEKRFSELGRLVVGSFIGILVVIGYDFVVKDELFPARLVPVYALILGFGFLLLFRTMARVLRRMLFKYGVGISNVLLVGNTNASVNVAHTISQTKFTGQRVLGIVGRNAPPFRHFTNFAEATDYLKQPIHAIIQTELYKSQDRNNEILDYAQRHHVSYRFVPGNTDLFVGNIAVELLAGGLPVIAVHQTALIGWGRILKRVFDLLVSLVMLVILSPLILLIALLVKLTNPSGAIFFRQSRLTRFNREFRVFKFRTHKAELSGLSDRAAFEKLGKPELYEKYKSKGYALDKDPRHTALGRILRKTSLDELPQLFNVVTGDVSLVGPRPLIAEELNLYDKKHAILSVKSGLTGLAQVSGRQNISFEERRKLDMYYVQNWSFWGDLVILLKTLRTVFTGNGAK